MSATELTGAAIVAQHLADVRTAAELPWAAELWSRRQELRGIGGDTGPDFDHATVTS